MLADFTRSIFRRFKRYVSVLLQQGRVRLDPDYDESEATKRQQRHCDGR